MSESMNKNGEVTVLFHKDDTLLIPPFELPREARYEKETFEAAYYRLCNDYGVVGSVDYRPEIFYDIDKDLRVFLFKPRYGELDTSEFFVPLEEVVPHLEVEDGYELKKPIDRQLVARARLLLLHRGSGLK